jgi:trimethylamine--corrinoid protein Co-methyltransferase
MASSMILYPEQIILDAEIAMNVYDTYKTFELSDFDETLAVIKEVGPRGHYLRQKHTRTHMRDFHYSPIFHQQDTDGKLRDPRDMAIEGFQKIFDSHQPEPLPDIALKEMDQILAAADKTTKKLAS